MNKYSFKNKTERRVFLEKVRNSAGMLGIGAALSSFAAHDKVFARMSENFISDHVTNFLDTSLNIKTSSKTNLAYLQTMNNVNQLIDSKESLSLNFLYSSIKENITSVLESGEYGKNTDGVFGLPKKLGDSLVAAFTYPHGPLKHGAFSKGEILRYADKAQTLEEGFIKKLSDQLEYESQYGYKLSEPAWHNNMDGLESVLTQFSSTTKSTTTMRRINNCNGICTIGGIVIVIIIIIIGKHAT